MNAKTTARAASAIFSVALAGGGFCSSVGTAGKAASPSPTLPPDFFGEKVHPLLEAKCFGCYGNDPKKIKSDFDLRTRATLLKGGKSGQPAVVPGHPEQSPLFLAVTRIHEDWEPMPPKE